jgi:hypothetical protein
MNTFPAFRDCAMAILNCEDNWIWKKAMRSCCDKQMKGKIVPDSPFRLMIKHCPEAAQKVMDNCTYQYTQYTNTWIMDYEFIDDAFNYTIVNGPVKTPENEYEGEYLSGLMLPL